MAILKKDPDHKMEYVGFGLAPIRQEGEVVGPDDPRYFNPTLRPVLTDFAIQMEYKLRKNDHKTGWRDLPIEAIFKLMMLEIEELKVAMEFLGTEDARGECIDVANFAMMLYDRLGMEKDKKAHVSK